MLKKILFVASAIALFSACGQQSSSSGNAQALEVEQSFGAPTTPDGAIPYAALRTQMGDRDSLPIKVVGRVGEVCQKKGCWMTIVAENTDMPEMRVTFKDYAFFMPKDLAGKRVVIDGFAYISETSVEELRHYAEDAGKSPDEIAGITEPLRELAFEAAGVLVLKN
ncbi:MAG: DUF4920 domain-containing protein [Saprospiraceae bacterium]|nr:DUF4920 domain-containing protein [Saprospiraceae bacterium]MDW8228283.1 DUF4920 domain-containing protein [Saprospiraceae bacterium]